MRNLFVIVLAVFLLLSQTACEMVYFDQPQPVDGKLLSSFPKEYRGTWKHEQNTLTIDKHSIKQTSFEIIKIAIAEADTSSSWLKKDKVIYKFEGDHLEYKAAYTIVSDTIIIHKPQEFEEHSLGQNIILKKVKKYLILNIKESNGMWQIVHIEKTKQGYILLKLLNNKKLVETIGKDKLTELTSPELDLNSEESRDYYYTNLLTKDDIIELIEAGSFSDTLINLSDNEKWISPLFGDFKN